MNKQAKIARPGELNVGNRTLFIRDNLEILPGMNSDSVDLIYLDPPFNSKRTFSAPIGSMAAGASFKDAWTLEDVDVAWLGQIAEKYPSLAAVISAAGMVSGKGNKAYLIYMARRLLEMKRILKDTGSIYLHCDPTMSHPLKMVMDAIFGKNNFQNEIVWYYYNKYGAGKRIFARNYDQIFFYSKNEKKYYFSPLREERDSPVRQLAREVVGGVLKNKRDEHGNLIYRIATDKKVDAVWRMPCLQPASKQYTGYPTQKPLELLRRIIKASTNKGDVVLDPFCGCATAMVAAEMEERQWLGIDISPSAQNLIKLRLQDAQDMLTTKGAWKQVAVRKDAPVRTDDGDLTVNPKEYKHELYGMQDGKCAGCRHEFPFRNMTIDHIMPREKGGQDIKPNLQLLCGACNSTKGKNSMDYLLARLRELQIIKPR